MFCMHRHLMRTEKTEKNKKERKKKDKEWENGEKEKVEAKEKTGRATVTIPICWLDSAFSRQFLKCLSDHVIPRPKILQCHPSVITLYAGQEKMECTFFHTEDERVNREKSFWKEIWQILIGVLQLPTV